VLKIYQQLFLKQYSVNKRRPAREKRIKARYKQEKAIDA